MSEKRCSIAWIDGKEHAFDREEGTGIVCRIRFEQSPVRYLICPSSGRFHVSEGTCEALECNAAINYINDQEDGAGRLYYKKSG